MILFLLFLLPVFLFIAAIVLREKWKEKHWHDTGKQTSMKTEVTGVRWGFTDTKSDGS